MGLLKEKLLCHMEQELMDLLKADQPKNLKRKLRKASK
tara:strand:- start:8137 stop:8250 length:114 start_codon:yes stop_codon:yes gene_type:complete